METPTPSMYIGKYQICGKHANGDFCVKDITTNIYSSYDKESLLQLLQREGLGTFDSFDDLFLSLKSNPHYGHKYQMMSGNYTHYYSVREFQGKHLFQYSLVEQGLINKKMVQKTAIVVFDKVIQIKEYIKYHPKTGLTCPPEMSITFVCDGMKMDEVIIENIENCNTSQLKRLLLGTSENLDF